MAAPDPHLLEGIPADAIQRQLDAVTASPGLSSSAQLCRFLRYVVERTLAGDTGSLKENLLGTEVFDRGIRFDPRTDPVVRVEARRLRAKLEEYYAAYSGHHGVHAPVIIRIPKGTYVPIFELGGRTAERTSRPEPGPGRSVAVLPFASVGPDPETDYFADGLTDEVINLLGNIPGLSVVSRSSVYQFKGRTGDVREFGRALNATHLVEGSVRRDGQRLRIAAQLVEAGNGYQSWAQTFERDWHQIFAIQTEIATAIASKLRNSVADSARSRAGRSPLYTENLDAYNALLKGRFYWNKRSVTGFQAALEAYRQAIAIDPNYAPAWAGLADCHTMLGFMNVASPAEARTQARQAAERAVALDGNLAAAHVAMAQMLAVHEWDWEGSIVAVNCALQLDPNNADAHYALSKALATLGRMDEALPHIFRAHQLDPLSLIIGASVGWELAVAKRYEESDEAYRASRELDPHFIWNYVLQAWSLQTRGLMREAIESLRRGVALSPDTTVAQGELAHALGKAGQRDEARMILAKFLERAEKQYLSPFDLARAFEGLGERELALEMMARACEERSPLLLFAGADPVFDPFRADPRFQELLRRMKLC